MLMHCFFVELAVAIAMFIIEGRGEGEGRGGGGRIYYTRRGQFALGQNVPGGTYSPRADCPGGGGGGGTSCATTPVHVYHECTYKANFLYYLPLFCVYKALLYRRMAEIHGHGRGGHPSWMAEILGML